MENQQIDYEDEKADEKINEDISGKKVKKNNDYGKGIIAGFLIASAVFFILVMGFNYFLNKNGSYLLGFGNSEHINNISYKVGLIEAYLDKYFMDEVDYEVMEEGIYEGLTASLGDIYTTYYTEEEYKKVEENSSGEYCGIGMVVKQDPSTKLITIQQIYNNSPAKEAGVNVGDVLYSVNDISVENMTLTELTELTLGKENSKLTMKVKRNDELIEFELVRRKIEKDVVTFEMKENNAGYVKIDEFDKVTTSQVKKAIESLEKDGMKKLIIDLRDNPGGMLTSVKEVASMFLPDNKLFLYSETKDGNRTDYYTEGKPILPDMPLVILINENSASASEAFSGAMKVYDRAKLVGTTSFGKGIMQSIFKLRDGSALKITIGKYYLPDGNNIHETGITPDYELEDNEETKEDEQLEMALEILG